MSTAAVVPLTPLFPVISDGGFASRIFPNVTSSVREWFHDSELAISVSDTDVCTYICRSRASRRTVFARGTPKVSAEMRPKASVLVINIMRRRLLSMNRFNRYCDSVAERIQSCI